MTGCAMASTPPSSLPPAARRPRRQSGKSAGPVKTSRIELRATEADRDLLDRAAAAAGTDRSSFLLAQGRLAAQRVLADREHFVLDADGQQEWERINRRPARTLPGLVRLLERPSPFAGSTADGPQA
jgi:uncharacterized protein (DUF1778 family)